MATTSTSRPLLRSFGAHAKYWAWILFGKVLLGVVFLGIVAEGARITIPPLAQRLHRLPGLAFLKNYQATYQLDLAPFFAVMIIFAVWTLWGRIIRAWLASKGCEGWWKETPHMLAVSLLGVVILFLDAVLFYRAMGQMGWGGGFSVSSVIATAMYVALMIFISFVSVNLYLATKSNGEDDDE